MNYDSVTGADAGKKAVVLQRLTGYRLPFWKFLVLSFFVTLVVISQWMWQAVDTWNRNNVFPVLGNERSASMRQDIASTMVTYYFDFFGELVVNPVAWAAIAAIIFILCWSGRIARSIRPSVAEYRLLGLLFAVVVAPTGDWYAGYTISIRFVVAFVIVGFVLPRTGRFNRLETICVYRGNMKERSGSSPSRIMHEEERKLLLLLPGPADLRSRLVASQLQVHALRDRAQNLYGDLASGKVDVRKYTLEREQIERSLAGFRFSSEPVTVAADRSSTVDRWRRELYAILSRPIPANDSADSWRLPESVRPADVALAIGPRTDWWDNGVLAARVGAVLSIPTTAYFSYKDSRDGEYGAFNSYLGLLHLLFDAVWEIGFWVVAAFILGCLWTTLPGRQGLMKGAVLWTGVCRSFRY